MLDNGVATGELYPSIAYKEPSVICECACGCKRDITEGYEHIFYEENWFYDVECLVKFLGAEWREVE